MRAKRPNAKLDEDAVRMIRQSRQTNADLAKLTGVSCEAVRLIRRGVTWKDVPQLDQHPRGVQ
jgi:hypothetical protein